MWNDEGGFGGGYQSMDTSGFGDGGGFMQDDQFASPSATSQEKKKSANKTQAIIPCTIKQLTNAMYDQANDAFNLPYVELNQVTFIGVIRSRSESSTNIVYMVNDMTADDIVVKKWINENQETDEELKRKVACRGNVYVKVTGTLKSFRESSRSVVAFNMTPISDYNQITHHILDVINSHLVLQKIECDASNVSTTPIKGSIYGSKVTTPGRNSFGGGNSLGLSGVQLQVHNIVATATSPEGMSLSTIRQRLRAVPEMQIRGAIEFLSNEGHIFSTTDDDHFRATESA